MPVSQTISFDVGSAQDAFESLTTALKESSRGYTWITRDPKRELEFSDRGEFCVDEGKENDVAAPDDDSFPEFLGTFAIKDADQLRTEVLDIWEKQTDDLRVCLPKMIWYL